MSLTNADWAEMRNLLARNLDAMAPPAPEPVAGITPAYRTAHEALESSLCDLQGLAWALGTLVMECDHLEEAGASAKAIFSVVGALQKEAETAVLLMRDQWVAVGG